MAFTRIVAALVAGIAAGSTLPAAPLERTAARVLLVVSPEGDGSGGARPGFEMDEPAQAWGILVDNGMQTVVASPRGGPMHADAYDAADRPMRACSRMRWRARRSMSRLQVRADTRACASGRRFHDSCWCRTAVVV